jgi:transposase
MNYNIYGSVGLPLLELPARLVEGFSGILAKHTSQKREIARILIIFELRNSNPLQVAKLLKCYKATTYRWYYRTKELIKLFEQHTAMNHAELERFLRLFLKDKERPGAPLVYTPEQQCSIITIAAEKPRKYGVESSEWTHWELAMVANRDGITKSISPSTVGRMLTEADIKPHQSKYWEFPNIEDKAAFNKKVAEICELYHNSERELRNQTHTVSVDEKTGIQALSRINPDKGAIPGKIAKLEFEYKRHGTQALIPSFEIGTGKIIAYRIGATRTEEDFAKLIESTIVLDSGANWIFIADQLNIHKSEALVRLIVKKLNLKDDLGKKGKTGLLKNLVTREKFLSDKSHRIRFVYTPKHCSWLNQIEIWFGILTRKILRRGNFQSISELRTRIAKFIEYYNTIMARVFKWTYKGKLLQA